MNFKKIINILFIFCFLLLIFLPIIFADKVGGKISTNENRYLAKFPQIITPNNKLAAGIRSGIENWINDNIWGRKRLYSLKAEIDVFLFNLSPSINDLFGKDGWRYLINDQNIKRVQKLTAPAPEQIELFNKKLGIITNHFNEKGITFFSVVMPYKTDIYPEYLPDTILQVGKDTFIEILLKESVNNENFTLYIPFKELEEEKKERYVYSKAYDNSHWNNYGAFIGYTAVMNIAQQKIPEIRYYGWDDFDITEFLRETYQAGRIFTTEVDYNFALKYERTAIKNSEFFDGFFDNEYYTSQDPWRSYQYYENINQDLPKAIIVGDSYTWMFMLENIAESFSELIFILINDVVYLDTLIGMISPDVVIFSCLDLSLWSCAFSYNCSEITLPKNTLDHTWSSLDIVNNEVITSKSFSIDSSLHYFRIAGWALDAINDTLASQVIIQVGDEYILATYGKKLEYVADYFDKQQFLNSGWYAVLNTKKVLDAGGFFVHVITADGSYKYEPQQYHVISR